MKSPPFKPRRRSDVHPVSDLWRRLRLAVLVLCSVLATGTLGYTMLGLNVLDAFYQTVVTVSTVGYREVGVVDNSYQVFTIGLILVGAGSVLYTVGVLIETLIEGRLTQEFGRRRMERRIDQLSDHIIVCGWGQVGKAITATLLSEGREVVVVDRDSNLEVTDDQLFVVGDATDDHILAEAGIERARSLVVGLNHDADNVYVTLSGRAARADLFIVARAMSVLSEPKLYRAGADRVVNPHQLGGAHMAALVTQPHVTEFLDITMGDRDLAVSINEVHVPAGSMFTRRPLSECNLAATTVLAIRRTDGAFTHHPDLSQPAVEGDILIALGTADELRQLKANAGQ